MKELIKDGFYGSVERGWENPQLGRVSRVDNNTGLVDVTYVTCPGGESNILFVHPLAYTYDCGIFSLPSVSSIVEVYTLHDRTRVCKPYMGHYKNVVGETQDIDIMAEQAGTTLKQLDPGEILILSSENSSIYLDSAGGLRLSDSSMSSIDLDPAQGGILLESARTLTQTAVDAKLRFGVVRRDQLSESLVSEEEVDNSIIPGVSPYQEFYLKLKTSQVADTGLQGVKLQLGDIFSEDVVPLRNPFLMGKFEHTNELGLKVNTMELYRTGSIDQTFGVANQLSVSHNAVLGSVDMVGIGSLDYTFLRLSLASVLAAIDIKETGEIELGNILGKVTITAAGGVNIEAVSMEMPGTIAAVPLVGATARALIPVTVMTPTGPVVGAIPVI